jgi:hypothetical protein
MAIPVASCLGGAQQKRQDCTLPGGELLWLLHRHVQPRRFEVGGGFCPPPCQCQAPDPLPPTPAGAL